MIGLTKGQVAEWMLQHVPEGTPIKAKPGLPQPGNGYEVFSFPLPGDSGKKTWLARTAYDSFIAERRVLVYLQNWQVFPSGGHIPLLLRLREALGESRPIEQCPGCLFSSDEGEDVISMMVLSLQFFWDCLVVAESGKTALFISHDECLDLISADASILLRFKKAIGGVRDDLGREAAL